MKQPGSNFLSRQWQFNLLPLSPGRFSQVDRPRFLDGGLCEGLDGGKLERRSSRPIASWTTACAN